MDSEFADLVLDSGEIVRIDCPSKYIDEFYESLEHAMKIGDWWSPNRFDGCTAEFLGHSMNRINMKKVVGLL